jgi:hypothetical protein
MLLVDSSMDWLDIDSAVAGFNNGVGTNSKKIQRFSFRV